MTTDHAIHPLDVSNRARWDAFVRARPEGTFFHLSGWQQVLEQAFGHRTHFLYLEQQGQIEAVLPLAEVKSRLFGHSLVSTPFCVYGGPIATAPHHRDALLDAATRLATELGVDHLELRSMSRQAPDWPCKELYVTFRKEISADDEQNLKAIPRKQRAVVRKGIDAGLHSEIDTGIDRFFHAYSSSVRNLGTPVFSRKYFRVLREVFGDECEILTITRQGETVASVMSFYFRDQVLPYYGGGTEAARACKANDFMYWALMCHAAGRGIRLFDYGRSKIGTGAYDFKKNWGFTPEPLYYEYHLVKGQALPDLNPLNPKYRLLINTWQRLPIGLANWLGPFIVRNLG